MDIDFCFAKINSEHQPFIREAMSSFNSVQASYRLKPQGEIGTRPWRKNINWSASRRKLAPALGASARIVVTDSPFSDNWFSHCEGNLCVVSTHQWFKLFAPPCLQSYLLLEFCLAAACFSAGVSDLDLKPHDRSVGCVGDMCAWKPDILLKLRAAYICGDHDALLRQYNVTPQQIRALEKIVELARAYALGRDEQKRRLGAIRSRRVFVVHGRHKAARDGVVTLLNKLGMEPIVIMNEPASGRTVIEQIEAYADVGFALIVFTPDDHGGLIRSPKLSPRPRQNVVFEYGLFVGLLGRRRVCCVAPSTEIDLPSDLAGVLQLRYQRSVDELCGRIRQELVGAGYLLDNEFKRKPIRKKSRR
jgi:predicted nucleotide-binding protein